MCFGTYSASIGYSYDDTQYIIHILKGLQHYVCLLHVVFMHTSTKAHLNCTVKTNPV